MPKAIAGQLAEKTNGLYFRNTGDSAAMFTLFHHPFCPHSRFVRLALGEYTIEARLVDERPWERRESFLVLNPAGTTPVLIEEGHPAIPGAQIISEYLDETRGGGLGEHRLLPRETDARVEVRRLTHWFERKIRRRGQCAADERAHLQALHDDGSGRRAARHRDHACRAR